MQNHKPQGINDKIMQQYQKAVRTNCTASQMDCLHVLGALVSEGSPSHHSRTFPLTVR